jgi:protein phosphatase
MIKLDLYGGTDRGMVRKNNEDSICFVDYAHTPVALGVVADGVGGHEGGEVASQMAVELIEEYVRKKVLQANSGGGYIEHWLERTLLNAIQHANQEIVNVRNHDKQLASMATTVVTYLIKDQTLFLAYLGDSRCYRWRKHNLEQLSHDHTVAQQMLDEGDVNEDQIKYTPYHHVLSRALGLDEELDIDTLETTLEDNDVYLLCSDGLTNCLNDQQIEEIISQKSDITDCAEELIASANDRGGGDNISVVLAKITFIE